MSEGTSGPADVGELEHLDDLEFAYDPQDVSGLQGPAPEAVVFDVGEVLIDETRVWATWADILGVSRFTFAAVLGAAIVQGEDHHVVFPHVAPNVDWEDFLDEHERRYGGFRPEDLYPDVRMCLEELTAMEIRVGIAGNQPARRRAQLEALRLPHDQLLISDDLGVEKPSLAFFDVVRTRMGVSSPDQVLYVGDRVDNDILPAIEAGMRTCWLKRGPWGQLQELPSTVRPDLILEGLGELPLLLGGWRDEQETA